MASLYLGIDTATRYLALALWSPERGTLVSFCKAVERDHTRRILGELEQLFHTSGATKSDLTGIGVGLGPGSYTGLRVGHATAQGLARGLSISYGGLSSLEAIAANVLVEGETGIAALDARRDNIYAGVFKKQDETIMVVRKGEKVARDTIRITHPKLPYFEDKAPDAGYLARCIYDGKATDKNLIYL